jgi:tRNA-splicing ligase RtcB
MGNSHARPIHQAENFFHDHGWPVAEKNVLKGKDSFRATAAIQFGTLGSGNHFVEVSVDESDRVWLVLHSGSRGAGNQLANFHVKVAQDLCAKQYIRLESKEFAYVQRDTPQYDAYVHDMLWGQEYAAAQREAMMDNLILAVELGVGLPVDSLATGVRVNCHHNYAEEIEPGLWLTRKGAINASVGMFGVVPGSMGTDTYIIAGLGNEESYCTSPHGAGRLLGRNVARKTLDVEQFREDMAGRTWLNSYADALLDEAPSAYKPIEVVMADSVDLIRPVAKLSAVINYKGL